MGRAYSQYGSEDFLRDMQVSRETLAGFEKWFQLLRGWNNSINLVQKSTVDQFWQRHALDSYQLCRLVPEGATKLLDMGAGAGFPGLALAIYLKSDSKWAGAQIDLVESNGKKCSFLRAVIRDLSLPARVLQERAEQIAPCEYDVISARAFAPLLRLCDYASPFWGPDTIGLFPKGRNYSQEDQLARKSFDYDLEILPSRSDDEAQILILRGLKVRS